MRSYVIQYYFSEMPLPIEAATTIIAVDYSTTHSVAIARYSGKIGMPQLKSKTGDGYRVQYDVLLYVQRQADAWVYDLARILQVRHQSSRHLGKVYFSTRSTKNFEVTHDGYLFVCLFVW